MATNFPSSADSFTNPTSGDTLDNPPHDQQHANINDAMEAVQASLLDGAPLHIDDANERVGVGTSSPQDVLHVVGDVTIEVDNDGSAAQPEVTLHRESATPADGDYLGQVKFAGKNDVGQTVNYAKITGKIGDVTDGTEDGLIEIANIKAGSQSIGYRFTSSDLKLLNGRGLEVDGDVGVGTTPSYKLDVDGDINATGDLRIGGNAIGAYTAYTPSSTGGLTLGNGTIQTSYTRINDFVHTFGYIVLGSTSSVATYVDIALPVTNATGTFESPTGNALFWDNNGYIWKGATLSVGNTTVRLIAEVVSGSHIRYSDLASTVPFTWATNDVLYWNIMYRAA